MTIHDPTYFGLGAGLLLFAVVRAMQTRRLSYLVWAIAAVMMMLDAVVSSDVVSWIFYLAIGLTVVLQLREGRSRRPEPL